METLRAMLKRHEGWLLEPYLCSEGHMTIGAGHNLEAMPLHRLMQDYLDTRGKITTEMAEELLTDDILNATANCLNIFPGFYSLSITRQNALIDFMFNVGIGTAKKFKKAIAAVNARDWETAADEFKDSKWFSQVGDRGPEIVEMIRSGV